MGHLRWWHLRQHSFPGTEYRRHEGVPLPSVTGTKVSAIMLWQGWEKAKVEVNLPVTRVLNMRQELTAV